MIIGLFICAVISIGFLMVLTIYSMYVYRKACDLGPLRETKSDLELKINNLMNDCAETEKELKDLRTEAEEALRLIDKKESMEEFLNQYEEVYNEKEKALTSLNDQIEERSKQISKLNEEYQQILQTRNEAEKEFDNLQATCKTLEDDKNKHLFELESIDKKATELQNQVNVLQSSRESLNLEVAQLKTLLEDLKDKQEEYNQLRSKINEYKKELSDLEEKITEAQNLSERLSEYQSSLKSNIRDYQDKCNILESRISELEQMRDDLHRDNVSLSSKMSDLKEKEEQYESLKQDIADSRKLLEQLEGKVSEKKIENSKLDAYNAASNYCWEDLDRADTQPIRHEKSRFNENEWLEHFSDTLERSNIKFSERTINAFHTGLKVADSSPLVVLSGISGTGKSLLPQLYAKASGMNFLSVAVQPRWDSPQDLLGFYNYMQSRFKATEFSRLLWSTDYYNNGKAKENFANVGKVPMNLVLLDEMNLARVEYYFSDLLSKLEIRRTIDKDDEISRRVAEIEIESGSTNNQKNTRRLFVNNNTLFVGTMNEDETTQSLSDKVMDRSNVLRFGKPAELQSKPLIEDFNRAYDDNSYLTMQAWESIKENNVLSSANEERLRTIVNDLNHALETINRPFAHRVWQSIENYVRLYPGADTNKSKFNDAVADQIEMKILPKLNGVEKDANSVNEALNMISKTIEDVKDHDLANAFSFAKDDTSSMFFQWKGVAR